MTLVYIIEMLLLGTTRPRLYSENNYEIPAVLMLTAIFFSLGKLNKLWNYFVVALSFMSMSKSGVIEGVILFLRNEVKNIKIFGFVFLCLFGLLFIFIAYNIINSRLTNIDIYNLDRVKFLFVFFELLEESTYLEVLFGHGIADILPYSSCLELKYWASLISQDYAYCDSTVLHSFILKLFYDTGLIGVLSIIGLWFVFVRKYFGKELGLTLFLIVIVCSISVSGFSNSIVIWPLFFGFFLVKEQTIGRG
ncbi:MAG: hypothetical protein HRU04_23770 [Oceanospirillaceae bacterium]|nr:hypothetical protein [Oceanospirillaceae bacterium]